MILAKGYERLAELFVEARGSLNWERWKDGEEGYLRSGQ